MVLKTTVTLQAGRDVWIKGSVFDSEVEDIPAEILAEYEDTKDSKNPTIIEIRKLKKSKPNMATPKVVKPKPAKVEKGNQAKPKKISKAKASGK